MAFRAEQYLRRMVPDLSTAGEHNYMLLITYSLRPEASTFLRMQWKSCECHQDI